MVKLVPAQQQRLLHRLLHALMLPPVITGQQDVYDPPSTSRAQSLLPAVLCHTITVRSADVWLGSHWTHSHSTQRLVTCRRRKRLPSCWRASRTTSTPQWRTACGRASDRCVMFPQSALPDMALSRKAVVSPALVQSPQRHRHASSLEGMQPLCTHSSHTCPAQKFVTQRSCSPCFPQTFPNSCAHTRSQAAMDLGTFHLDRGDFASAAKLFMRSREHCATAADGAAFHAAVIRTYVLMGNWPMVATYVVKAQQQAAGALLLPPRVWRS